MYIITIMSGHYCDKCKYITYNKQNYEKHLETNKHKSKKESFEFVCICKKDFKTHSGLWRHKQQCETFIKSNKEKTTKSKVTKNSEEVLLSLRNMEQNQRNMEENQKKLENIIIELVKNQKPIHQKNSIKNSFNKYKNFNISVFLNEHCKDAIDIIDFAKNVALKMEEHIELSEFSKMGYIDSMVTLITKSLAGYSIYERPIHNVENDDCEYFVRYKNKWNAEMDDYSPILDKAIKMIDTEIYDSIEEKVKDDKDTKQEFLKGTQTKFRDQVKVETLHHIYVEKPEIPDHYTIDIGEA